MQDINKQVLTQSAAGMRFIALMTLFNTANYPRLKRYIGENYHPSLFEEFPASAHLALLKAQRRLTGKIRVRQVVAGDKYHVIVLTESESGGDLMLMDLTVEEDYPHLILRFDQSKVS